MSRDKIQENNYFKMAIFRKSICYLLESLSFWNMHFSISTRLTPVSDSQAARNGDIIGRVTAPGNLSNAKQWLQNCLLRHKECLPPAAYCTESYKPPLPTRVINVGSSNDDITLLVTEGQTGEYVALSHRCSLTYGKARMIEQGNF